jgi:hypothetical protein
MQRRATLHVTALPCDSIKCWSMSPCTLAGLQHVVSPPAATWRAAEGMTTK